MTDDLPPCTAWDALEPFRSERRHQDISFNIVTWGGKLYDNRRNFDAHTIDRPLRSIEDDFPLLYDWIMAYKAPGAEWASCDFGVRSGSHEGARVLDSGHRVCEKVPCRPEGWINHERAVASRDGFYLVTVLENLFPRQFNHATLHYPPEHQEVLKYGPGGHFAFHIDRTRGKNHLGTLLLVLPSLDLVGGKLVTEETIIDEATGLTKTKYVAVGETVSRFASEKEKDTRKPFVAFIPLGLPHTVTPIERGHRYVLKAAVFGKLLAERTWRSDELFRGHHIRED